MVHATDSDHERLEVLIGTWKTDGWTKETPDAPAVKIEAVDSYEWLPGGHGLLHTVDARVGDEEVEGAEIIGYDPIAARMSRSTSAATDRRRTRRTLARRARASPGGCAARRTGSQAFSARMAASSPGTGSG